MKITNTLRFRGLVSLYNYYKKLSQTNYCSRSNALGIYKGSVKFPEGQIYSQNSKLIRM